MQAQRRRRLLFAAIAVAGSALVIASAIGVYGLLRGPARDEAKSAPTGTTTATMAAREVAKPEPLSPQTEAVEFARTAASALFGWDTRGSAGPSDWAQVLVDVGDPDEGAGLASDVRSYLPTIEQWEQLKVHGTRQWLEVESARIPDAWATARAQAAPGQLPPGATAYTISGVRHRDGIWDGEPVATSTEVAFTIFLACARGEDCRLLRLSRLDEPLE